MMFNSTFKQYASYISWRSVLLVEETVVPGENHRPAASHWQTLSHIIVSNTPRHVNPTTIRSRPYLPPLTTMYNYIRQKAVDK
jgi:hypothetical protein